MTAEMHRVVAFSGGVGSYLAAKRTVERHGAENVTLLFTDTRMEDEDLYRFLLDASARLRARLVESAEGRTPWEVFRDVRFLGNSRVDPCSRILKREQLDKWLVNENHTHETAVLVFGIGWTELHRAVGIAAARAPWICEFPMVEAPHLTPKQELAEVKADGLRVPRLYELGFAHNNCGGFCVKAGQAHFANLLEKMPERYADHEAKEAALRAELGKDVAILEDRRGGVRRPMTLAAFRERVKSGDYDRHEVGGCSCFAGPTA